MAAVAIAFATAADVAVAAASAVTVAIDAYVAVAVAVASVAVAVAVAGPDAGGQTPVGRTHVPNGRVAMFQQIIRLVFTPDFKISKLCVAVSH